MRALQRECHRLHAQMTLQMHNLAAVELAEVTPFKGNEPARRVAIANSVEFAARMDRRASIPIALISNHFSPSIVVENHNRTLSTVFDPASPSRPASRHSVYRKILVERRRQVCPQVYRSTKYLVALGLWR